MQNAYQQAKVVTRRPAQQPAAQAMQNAAQQAQYKSPAFQGVQQGPYQQMQGPRVNPVAGIPQQPLGNRIGAPPSTAPPPRLAPGGPYGNNLIEMLRAILMRGRV